MAKKTVETKKDAAPAPKKEPAKKPAAKKPAAKKAEKPRTPREELEARGVKVGDLSDDMINRVLAARDERYGKGK